MLTFATKHGRYLRKWTKEELVINEDNGSTDSTANNVSKDKDPVYSVPSRKAQTNSWLIEHDRAKNSAYS